MPKKYTNLGDLQQLTMLAVARLGENAFGGAIQSELEDVAKRKVSVSAAYVTLVRLEDQGLVRSTKADPDPVLGGKGKRYFQLTPAGWEALEASRVALASMWEGVTPA